MAPNVARERGDLHPAPRRTEADRARPRVLASAAMIEGNGALSFVPTMERARSGFDDVGPISVPAELLTDENLEERRLAAILLIARVLRREAWEESVDASARLAGALPTEVPPIPEGYVEQASVIRVGPALELHPCTMCDVRRPGYQACHHCGGSGYLTGTMESCGACGPASDSRAGRGEGFIVCSACEGAKETVSLRVRHVTDRLVSLSDVFVPEALRYAHGLFGFDGALGTAVGELRAPPEELRFDLLATETTSAYRGAQRRADPTFHGHDFDDALGRARSALRGMAGRGTVLRYEFAAFAVPFLWIRQKVLVHARSAAFFVHPGGRMCGFAAAPEPIPT
jgi:hypothetical protein